ncbi:MAG TPA: 3-methyl-2-oxobutanoate hydroxymethyltransferase [Acidimicrobiales bacterium]|nr:3-methyl-2-oxobutanoate hydroxymethyltransferase [Acidimicrobiales bacterium]
MTTVPEVRARKGGDPLVMVTAYDAPGARVADEAGVDMLLVGDSVAMVVLGHPDTLHVTVDDMVHHTAAVARGARSALVVADLPWLSYHTGRRQAVENAGRLVRAGASAVKLEGGAKRAGVIEALVDAEIPVVGHIGLTPQSVLAMGGFKVQGKGVEAARTVLDDAKAVVAAGVFALVLEGLPTEVARLVTDAVDVPTIGIGAGPGCDGQVLVWHDVLGFGGGDYAVAPRFVRRYADLRAAAVAGLAAYAADVRSGAFPADAESYHLPPGVADLL